MPFSEKFSDRNYINKILKYDNLISYRNSLTNIDDLNEFIYKFINLKITPSYGIYNVTNHGSATAKEIVDILKKYLKKKKLKAEFMGRGSAWLDTGNIETLFETSQFISSIEKRQGLKIACLEEIALNNKWISKSIVKKQINFYGKCGYSDYLKKLI